MEFWVAYKHTKRLMRVDLGYLEECRKRFGRISGPNAKFDHEKPIFKYILPENSIF